MHPLAACLPYYMANDLFQNPEQHPVARVHRFDAVVLFADISGFTPMSESLARTGKKGTEELTSLLNQYFEAMISLIQLYGGTVAKFAGDALTVLFPSGENRQAAVQRAVTCALAMQKQMAAYQAIITSAGTFELAMKAGLAIGDIFSTSVGDTQFRLEYIVAGKALEQAAQAEHRAKRGEILTHPCLLPLLAHIENSPLAEDFAKITNIMPPANPAPLASLPSQMPPGLLPIFAAYLHPTVSHLLVTEGQANFINEHRKVSILFISFDDFEYNDDLEVATKIQTYFQQMLGIIRSYDGHLRQIDMGDKGSKYIVLFGAPLAHEDDEVRALRCALDLRFEADKLSIVTRTGINTGQVFCGQIGSDLRRDYAAIGDAVNLSARLMQAAPPGQILVSQTSQSNVPPDAFRWQPLEPILVKGKTTPITIFELLSVNQPSAIRLQEPHYTLPMVGRELELELVKSKLELLLKERHGQIIGIVGEAGIGKSRLVAEIIQLAQANWLIGYGGECQSFGTNNNYLVWQPIFRAFFGININWDLADQISVLETQLELIDPNLLPRLPLLAALFNLPIPDNDLTRVLEGQLRKTSLEVLLTDCLKARAKTTPLLLVLEDCHWLDPLSHDLLESLGQAINDLPVLILLAYRPPQLERLQVVRVTKLPNYNEIKLHDFTPVEAERLIELKLNRFFGATLPQLPTKLVAQIRLRAGGNPFYIEELLNYLQTKGLDLHQTQALEQLELPASLESLIISRIDQLTEEEKITIKVASVIGRLFKANWLWQIYPQLGKPIQVMEQLENLSQLDLTPLDKVEPEVEYLFKHITTQEVAYESLTLATRTLLHAQIGAYIESVYPDKLEQFYDLLAFHYGRSNNLAKQREYFRHTADAAKTAYANSTAIDYNERLLLILPNPAEQVEVMLKLNEVWQLIGKWQEAEAIARKALLIVQQISDPLLLAQCYKAIGSIYCIKGLYQEALVWLEQARTRFEAVNDTKGLADTAGIIGKANWGLSNYEQALATYTYQRELAEERGDAQGVAYAIGSIGNIYLSQSKYEQALSAYSQRLAIATQFKDELSASHAIGNMGIVYKRQGKTLQAMDCYLQQLQTAIKLGDRAGLGRVIANIGGAYEDYGYHEQQLACIKLQLQIAIELGDLLLICTGVSNLATAFFHLKWYDQAEPVYNQAVLLCQYMNNSFYLSNLMLSKIELYIHQVRYPEALAYANEAYALAKRINNESLQFSLQLEIIYISTLMNTISKTAALKELNQLLQLQTDEKQVATILLDMWRLDGNEKVQKDAAALYYKFYQATKKGEYRRLYLELTGEDLTQPLLPDLPPLIAESSIDLAALLSRLETYITLLPVK